MARKKKRKLAFAPDAQPQSSDSGNHVSWFGTADRLTDPSSHKVGDTSNDPLTGRNILTGAQEVRREGAASKSMTPAQAFADAMLHGDTMQIKATYEALPHTLATQLAVTKEFVSLPQDQRDMVVKNADVNVDVFGQGTVDAFKMMIKAAPPATRQHSTDPVALTGQDAARSMKESGLFKAGSGSVALAGRDSMQLATSGYVSPITGDRNGIGDGLGAHRDGKPGSATERHHSGVDFQAKNGSKAVAVVGGTVLHVGNNPGGYDHYAIVQGDDGNMYRYAPHGGIDVKVGQHVDQGDSIGTIGRRHLHFEVAQPGDAGFTALKAGGNTQWYGKNHAVTSDPLKVLGIQRGATLVAGKPVGDPVAVAMAAPAAGGFIKTMMGRESYGGKNVSNVDATTSSGRARGYIQITDGTWKDFAPKAGVDLAKYPTALSAPLDVQMKVGGAIPLGRWDQSTLAALKAAGYTVDPNATLAENVAANGQTMIAGAGGQDVAVGGDRSAGGAAALAAGIGRHGLRKGSGNAGATRALQSALNDLGATDRFGHALKVDGVFGNRTYEAVKNYQTDAGGLAVDGVVGPRTFKHINSDMRDASFGVGVHVGTEGSPELAGQAPHQYTQPGPRFFSGPGPGEGPTARDYIAGTPLEPSGLKPYGMRRSGAPPPKAPSYQDDIDRDLTDRSYSSAQRPQMYPPRRGDGGFGPDQVGNFTPLSSGGSPDRISYAEGAAVAAVHVDPVVSRAVRIPTGLDSGPVPADHPLRAQIEHVQNVSHWLDAPPSPSTFDSYSHSAFSPASDPYRPTGGSNGSFTGAVSGGSSSSGSFDSFAAGMSHTYQTAASGGSVISPPSYSVGGAGVYTPPTHVSTVNDGYSPPTSFTTGNNGQIVGGI